MGFEEQIARTQRLEPTIRGGTDMGAWSKYVLVSAGLIASTSPASILLGRRYPERELRRFRLGMAGTLAVQQALVGLDLKRRERSGAAGQMHSLAVVDVMTLSRGIAAAFLVGLLVSGRRDRTGLAGWMGWSALLYGAILCDWLDGPMARRHGSSELGAVFDLESDSWLTLCTAGAAVGWGDLPITVTSAPLLRYVLLLSNLRNHRYAGLHVDEPDWVRPAGIVQMLVFIAALAPFGGRATWNAVRLIAPTQAPLQVVGLLLLQRRRARK